MIKIDCETVLCAVLARNDGEAPTLTDTEIQQHLTHCPQCRQELKEITRALQSLDGQKRRQFTEDLWPTIAVALGCAPQAQPNYGQVGVFSTFVVILLLVKLLEVYPTSIPGYVPKVISVILTLILFVILRQNPLHLREHLSRFSHAQDILALAEQEPLDSTEMEDTHASL